MGKSVNLLLVVILSAAAYGKDERTPPSAPPALPICRVLAKAAEYDGKEVTVRGIYRFEIHGSELFGEGCRSRENNVSLSGAPDFKLDKEVRKAWRKIPPHAPADVVLRGRFVVCTSENNCAGAFLNQYEIKVREYLFVQPVQVEAK